MPKLGLPKIGLIMLLLFCLAAPNFAEDRFFVIEKDDDTLTNEALVHMQRGMEFFYNEEYQNALQEYRHITSIAPQFAPAFVRLGSIYYQLGDKVNAKRYWQRALMLSPKDQNLPQFIKRVEDEILLEGMAP